VDIIPQADTTVTEEHWQALVMETADSLSTSNHSDTSHHQSLPKIYLVREPVPDFSPREANLPPKSPPKQSSNSPRRFANIRANPLFQLSQRFATKSTTEAEPEEAPEPLSEDEKGVSRASPPRTNSGGYFVAGKTGQKSPKSCFWTKIELEKKQNAQGDCCSATTT
jgi:hypothetical protein